VRSGKPPALGSTGNSFCLGGTQVSEGLCRFGDGRAIGASTPASPCFGGGFGVGGCQVERIGFGGSPASSPCIGGGPCNNSVLIGQRRGINWKVVGPAIGAAGAGAFALYRNHVAKRRADLAVRPNGTVQVSYAW
jgi:hypothetical protein